MQLFVAILKDFRSENIEFSKYQLIIDRGRDFVEAVYFLAKKKTASPFAFQQPPRAGVFSRSPTPYPPPPFLTKNQTWPVGETIASLQC